MWSWIVFFSLICCTTSPSPVVLSSAVDIDNTINSHTGKFNRTNDTKAHRLAFFLSGINERGTTVAVYDYADYSERYLNYSTPIIIYFGQDITSKREQVDTSKVKILNKFIGRFGKSNVYSVLKEEWVHHYPQNSINSAGWFRNATVTRTTSSTHGKSEIIQWTEEWKKVDKILKKRGITDVYVLRSGHRIEKMSSLPHVRNLVHVVFDAHKPFGDVYARISDIVPAKANINITVPVVPHMINRPLDPTNTTTMRQTLQIPNDAVVFGRYGGYDTFSIKFVQALVCRLARKKPNIYFLFANTKQFCYESNNSPYKTEQKRSSTRPGNVQHSHSHMTINASVPSPTAVIPNIIHLNSPLLTQQDKELFIRTCDAMLHARHDGETFGLSVGEFSIMNRPIITSSKHGELFHVKVLGDKGIYYSNEVELERIILNFRSIHRERGKQSGGSDWNAYQSFYPEHVMDTFYSVFLSGEYDRTSRAWA